MTPPASSMIKVSAEARCDSCRWAARSHLPSRSTPVNPHRVEGAGCIGRLSASAVPQRGHSGMPPAQARVAAAMAASTSASCSVGLNWTSSVPSSASGA